jgi:hypothetical protein
MIGTVVLLCAPSFLALASFASAATVRIDAEKVLFEAASGEANRLVATEREGVTFHDRRASVRASGRCEQVDAHTVRCPKDEREIIIRLGDAADRVAVRSLSYSGASVYAGAGNDRVRGGLGLQDIWGGSGRDVLRGGPDNDDLHAGSGRDKLFGERGDDELYDDRTKEPTSPDRFDGGRGRYDTLSYETRRVDLEIDFRDRPLFAAPERDRIVNIENLQTGSGDDRLTGDAQSNFLYSWAGGRDVLIGREGHDNLQAGSGVLVGGPGADRLDVSSGRSVLRGGPGPDDVHSIDTFSPLSRTARTRPNEINCGPGDDHVHSAPWDRVTACEIANGWEYDLDITVRPQVGDGEVTFRAECGTYAPPCSGRATLEGRGGTSFGSARVSVPDTPEGESAPITVPLTAAGKRAVADNAVVRVAFRTAARLTREVYEGRLTFGFTTRLRRAH